jgi:hypothetical protein
MISPTMQVKPSYWGFLVLTKVIRLESVNHDSNYGEPFSPQETLIVAE